MRDSSARHLLWLALGPLALAALGLAVYGLYVIVTEPDDALDNATVVVLLLLLGSGVLTLLLKTRRPSAWLGSAIPSCLVTLVATGAILGVAWDANPQGEFHSDDGIHLGALLPLAAAWFVVVDTALLVVLQSALAGYAWISRRRVRSSRNQLS